MLSGKSTALNRWTTPWQSTSPPMNSADNNSTFSPSKPNNKPSSPSNPIIINDNDKPPTMICTHCEEEGHEYGPQTCLSYNSSWTNNPERTTFTISTNLLKDYPPHSSSSHCPHYDHTNPLQVWYPWIIEGGSVTIFLIISWLNLISSDHVITTCFLILSWYIIFVTWPPCLYLMHSSFFHAYASFFSYMHFTDVIHAFSILYTCLFLILFTIYTRTIN